ncbi:MAG: DinB family protein [Phycisphaerae bacterium]|nr:DinB family protein [Phycisphaerae bacterium]MCZ2399099.1 DinB family protein [Phycisphaerae bacterium]
MAKRKSVKRSKASARTKARKVVRRAGSKKRAAARPVKRGGAARRPAAAARSAGNGPAGARLAQQRSLGLLRFARGLLAGMLKDFPNDKLLAQPSPTDNHALWTMGHLAATYQWFLQTLGDKGNVPDSYQGLFSFGTTPSPFVATYPPADEVRGHFEASFERFMQVAGAMPAKELMSPPAIDTGGFAATKLDVVERAAWHEGWHTGQVASLRRAFGLPRLMG